MSFLRRGEVPGLSGSRSPRADDLLAEVRHLQGEARDILGEARRTGNGDLALRAIARLERQTELIAKVLGLVDAHGPISVNVSNVTGGSYPVLDDVARFEALLREIAIKQYPPPMREVAVIGVTTTGNGLPSPGDANGSDVRE